MCSDDYYSYYEEDCYQNVAGNFYGLSVDQISAFTESVAWTLEPATLPSSSWGSDEKAVESLLFRPAFKRLTKDKSAISH